VTKTFPGLLVSNHVDSSGTGHCSSSHGSDSSDARLEFVMTTIKRRSFSKAFAMGAVAGSGHCLLEASTDFLVVWGYPPDQNWAIYQDAPTAAMMQ
jgi:hypothetical protein